MGPKKLGIFSCDAHKVYWGSPARFISRGSWKSFVNTGVFIKIWKNVRWDAIYQKHDWTVKVDPDAVFYPLILKKTLLTIRPQADLPLYINNQEKWKSRGFAGPLEVFSRAAMELYFKNGDACELPYRLSTSGEDTYM